MAQITKLSTEFKLSKFHQSRKRPTSVLHSKNGYQDYSVWNLTKHNIANIPFVSDQATTVHEDFETLSSSTMTLIYGNLSAFFPRVDAIYANYIHWLKISRSKIALINSKAMISMENSYFRRRKILLSFTVFESEVIWRWDNAKISHLQCEWLFVSTVRKRYKRYKIHICDQTSNLNQYWSEISKQRLTYAFFAKTYSLLFIYILIAIGYIQS